MWARLGYVALGLLAYLVFLAANLPASLVLDQVKPPKGVSWGQVEGTVWRGRLNDLSLPDLQGLRLDWDLNTANLSWGELAADLKLEGEGLKAHGLAGHSLLSGANRLTDLQANARAQLLRDVLALPADLEGVLEMNLTALNWQGEDPPSGEGQLLWRNAQLVFIQPLRLGRVRARLTGSTIQVTGSGGELEAEGEVVLKPGLKHALDIRFKPTASMSSANRGMLNSLGKRQRDGSYRLKSGS